MARSVGGFGIALRGRTFAAKAAAGAAILWTLRGPAFYYNSSKWGTNSSFSLEANIRAMVGTFYVRDFDITAGAALANSELSTTNLNFRRLRSTTPLVYTNDHEYRIQSGALSGHSGEIDGVQTIVQD